MDLKRYDRSLLRELSECLKQNDRARAMAVFEAHSIAQPSMLHTQEYNRLLAVLSSDPKQGGRVRAHMLARGVQDDETTVTLEVRRLVRCADFDGATALLQSAQAAATPTATPSVSPSVSRTASPLSAAPPAAPAPSAQGGGPPQPAEAPPHQQ